MLFLAVPENQELEEAPENRDLTARAEPVEVAGQLVEAPLRPGRSLAEEQLVDAGLDGVLEAGDLVQIRRGEPALDPGEASRLDAGPARQLALFPASRVPAFHDPGTQSLQVNGLSVGHAR